MRLILCSYETIIVIFEYKKSIAEVQDKLSALDEGPMAFQNDFQVDIAACCVPYRPKKASPELVKDCVAALEPAYTIVRGAKSNDDMRKAAPIFKSYMTQLLDPPSGDL